LAVFAAVTLRYDSRAQARRLVATLFFLAAAISLYGTVETISGREMIWNAPKTAYLGAVTGTFVNRNNFAAFASLALGGGLGLALYYRAKLAEDSKPSGGVERLFVFAFAGVICLLGVLLSRSRGGVAGVLLAAFPTAWLLAERRSRRTFALLAAAVLLGALAMGWWVGREPLGQRFATIAAEAGAADSRPAAWLTTLRVAVRAWPLGAGGGTFVDHFRLVPDSGILVRYNHAHSDPLELLVEYGVLGALAFFGAIAWVIVRSVRALRERHSRFSRALTIGGLAGIAAVLLHCLFDFPLQNPGVRVPFFAVLSVVYLVANRRLTR
jgi:O-antigen ligase